MDGILNVHKPIGPTSHDVVAAVRRMSKQRRVGHAGTLDPAASGVLLVCLGQATRLIEYMTDHDKEYCAEITLGQSTDTYDATGRPTSAALTPSFTRDQVAHALSSFVGKIAQTAPAYSALKQGGQPLYRLARAGMAVQPPVREVEIYSISLLAWEAPHAVAVVRCSKGTYIRSLAHDLGQLLGCGGHLRNLVRLASGPFTLCDAVDLDQLSQAFAEGYADELAYQMDEAVLDLPAVILGPDSQRAVTQGNRWSGPPPPAGLRHCRAYGAAGEFVALLEYEDGATVWHPKKVFSVGR